MEIFDEHKRVPFVFIIAYYVLQTSCQFALELKPKNGYPFLGSRLIIVVVNLVVLSYYSQDMHFILSLYAYSEHAFWQYSQHIS